MVEQKKKKKKVNLRMKLKSLERSDVIGKLDVFLCQISKHKFPNLKFGVIEMPVCAKSLQSCLTLCDPMDYSPPVSSVHGDSADKNTGVSCHCLLPLRSITRKY